MCARMIFSLGKAMATWSMARGWAYVRRASEAIEAVCTALNLEFDIQETKKGGSIVVVFDESFHEEPEEEEPDEE